MFLVHRPFCRPNLVRFGLMRKLLLTIWMPFSVGGRALGMTAQIGWLIASGAPIICATLERPRCKIG